MSSAWLYLCLAFASAYHFGGPGDNGQHSGACLLPWPNCCCCDYPGECCAGKPCGPVPESCDCRWWPDHWTYPKRAELDGTLYSQCPNMCMQAGTGCQGWCGRPASYSYAYGDDHEDCDTANTQYDYSYTVGGFEEVDWMKFLQV